MECLQIDWQNIDDTFERDEFYESIQAPKWIDFTAPLQPVDDHEWFCGRAGCTHTKKTLHQTEDSILSDSPKSTSLHIARKLVTSAESTASTAGGKRARAVVSSSYSSISGIKEAFAKHKVLHLAKMPCVVESNGLAVKKSTHARENQNPNQTCKAQVGMSKIPILKASESLAKKMKMTDSKCVDGKQTHKREVLAGVLEPPTSSIFLKQVNQSQTRVILDVSKSTSLLGMKDVVQKKSMLTRKAVKEQDVKVTDPCRASEPQNKKDDAARIPFSVYASRFAMTSSLAMPSKHPMMPSRSLQNVQLGNQKSAPYRPLRIVARKEHKTGAISVQTHLSRSDYKESAENKLLNGSIHTTEGNFMQAKHMVPMLNKQNIKDNAILTNTACMRNQQTHASNDDEDYVPAEPMVQHSTTEDEHALPLVCDNKTQISHCSEENQEKCKARHDFEEIKDLTQNALEEHLEKLYLSTPNNKHCGELKMGQLGHSNNISKQEKDQPQYVDSVVDLEMVSSQLENGMLACEMEASCLVESAAENDKALSHHADVGQSLRWPLNCGMNRSFDSQNAGNDIDSSALQMSRSFVGCMHTAEELPAPSSSNMGFDKEPKQVHPVKDWQRARGLKRKSSELNFKVNCSSKDHIYENDKVTMGGAVLNSFICQQAQQSSLTSIKAAPLCGSVDSCKEQHKKIKTTKAQPFKPFRLRTEERGALKELGLSKKEQVVPNPQELVHRALRMPSFGPPFRPQRSTKKLTVPKELSFHSSRIRKTCTGPSALLGS